MRRLLAHSALFISVAACGDNIRAGGGTLVVSPRSGLFTDEAGATDVFTISLTNAPDEDVVIELRSTDTSEGEVTPRTLIFDANNFSDAQTVTVTGVDDPRADGAQAYLVRVETNTLGTIELDVLNGDNDTVGITVTPLVGLMTSEAGLDAGFDVALTSQPSGSVVVPVSSSDTSEGTLSVDDLTFTTDNWNIPQTVTIEGAQDTVNDGMVSYTIVLGAATSTDSLYNGFDADDVQVVNVDDDIRGVTVTPTDTLATTEAGGQDSFNVVLQAPPTSVVNISVGTSDSSEAVVSTSLLQFTTTNWNVPRTVTVTGVNDNIDDDPQAYTIVLGTTSSADTSYNGINVPDIAGSNADDDTAGFTVTPTSGLVTTEGGGTASFTVALTSEPTANVTIGVTSSDTTEATPVQTVLMFDASNWNVAQRVTINGVNDTMTDGNQAYTIVLAAASSADTKYNGLNPPDVTGSNTDNDIPGFTIDPLQLTVSEFQDSDPFSIVLNTPPTANVTVTFTSTDTSEGVVPMSVTFTPTNWNVPQNVNVTGVNDTVADGNIMFQIVTGAATSTDPAYSGLNPPDIDVTNLDNDIAQVYVKSRPRLTVSENGTSTTFRVQLTVAPNATVTCPIQVSDTTEGSVSPMQLVFNNTAFQTVTLTGVDDMIIDNDVAFTVQMLPCSSTDLQYQGSNPRDVPAVNRDND